MDGVRKNSILIVDDEKSNLEELISILSPEHTVYITKSGSAAIKMAGKYLPDLILLDIVMPDINGFDVLAILKKTEKTKNIPVIFITGLDTVEDEEKGLALDAADFIHKPFSARIVKSRVRNQLQIVNQIRSIEQYAHNMQMTLTKMEAIVNNYGGIIWSIDNAGVITSFNGLFLKNIGITPEFVIGKNIETLRGNSKYVEIVENAKKTFHEGKQDWSSEIDGNVLHTHATPMYDGAGKVIGVVGSTNDVTEIVKLQRELEAALEAAQAASHSKTTFLTNMSHELRTPLNVIIGLTSLMLEESGLSANLEANLLSVGNAGGTLLSIVNDILDISKIESGKLTLISADYHVPSLLNDLIVLLKTYIGEKPIDFKLNIDENLPISLNGDELRVRQIIYNLLSNAVKYTNEGTVDLIVKFERDRGDVWMDISVKDTGKGIREENLKELFNDYYQADARANHKTEGTGLGLSITRRLAEMMDGSVTVESKYGEGSTFRVRFRQGFVNDTKIGAAITESLRNFSFSETKRRASNKLVRADLSGVSVLVVDDMRNNLDVTEGLLRKYNLQVDCLTDGQAAIDRIRGGKKYYNAIFMDHMMPGMDGIETVKAIRALETDYAKNVPIIALTANAVQGAEKMFLENSFQDFLCKPVDLMLLDSVLKKWVRGQMETGSEDESESGEGNPSAEEDGVSIDIPGLDVEKALALYDDEMDIYISLLRSFATHTPVILDKLRGVTLETLPDNVINAHGLKGSCASIGAEQLRTMIAEMESSARIGDFDKFLTLLDPCLKDAEQLMRDINAWLDVYDSEHEAPLAHAPDSEVLAKLKRCCQSYDMSGIEEAMEELERFSYEMDADLVGWLREKIDVMELEEVALRL